MQSVLPYTQLQKTRMVIAKLFALHVNAKKKKKKTKREIEKLFALKKNEKKKKKKKE